MRDYKRKAGSRCYMDFSDDNFQKAIDMVNNGSTISAAAEKFNITRTTLSRRLSGVTKNKHGGQMTLSKTEELDLVHYVSLLSSWAFPIAMFDLQHLVKNFLDKRGVKVQRFANNLPGINWAKSFMKRHNKTLSSRLANNIKSSRAMVSQSDMEIYFSNLKEMVEGLPATHIFNYDETNLSDDPGCKKIIAKRGLKYADRIVNHSKSATSIMFCGSAAGDLLPPYVIYKSENLWSTWTTGGPSGARYNRTKHGWFDAVTFADWFERSLVPCLKKMDGIKVVLGDNLSSHFSENVLWLAEKNQIRFACLPPNLTHICQPLDVAFFRPLKIAWREILSEFKDANRRMAAVPKDVFPSLLKKLYRNI